MLLIREQSKLGYFNLDRASSIYIEINPSIEDGSKNKAIEFV